MQLTGYHGTSEEGCRGILKDKRFKCSTGKSQWLGDGVYFFQDDRHQAYMFFKFKFGMQNAKRHEEIRVLKADIQAEDDNVIDLVTDEGRQQIDDFKKKFARDFGGRVKYQLTDTALLNLLYQNVPYDLVRAVYDVPGKNKKWAHGYKRVHIQICVKNQSCIDFDSLKEVSCDDFR
jgi:hypothetical protein